MTQEATAFPSPLTQRVAAEIRAELGRQQMSQRQLAEKLGIDQALVSRRLAAINARPWTTDEIDRIASALGVPVDRLLGAPAGAVTA